MVSYIKTSSAVNMHVNGETFVVQTTDPKFGRVMAALKKAQQKPTDKNVEALKDAINPSSRILRDKDSQFAIKDGNLFVKGIDIPVPAKLHKYIEEALENDEYVGHLVNFFKQLALNPDERVREQLFGFLTHNGHPITSKGFFITYKAVALKNKTQNSLADEVIAKRKELILDNKDPKKYFLYEKRQSEDSSHFTYYFHESKQLEDVSEFENEYTLVDNLKKVIDNLADFVDSGNSNSYTDFHTGRMNIQVGKPVAMPREDCDSDPNRTCSSGLHVGSMEYVGDFGHSDRYVLECLVSPANVAAVPTDYNNTKMRACEYFPIAVSKEEATERFTEGDYAAFVDTTLTEQQESLEAQKAQIEDLKSVIK